MIQRKKKRWLRWKIIAKNQWVERKNTTVSDFFVLKKMKNSRNNSRKISEATFHLSRVRKKRLWTNNLNIHFIKPYFSVQIFQTICFTNIFFYKTKQNDYNNHHYLTEMKNIFSKAATVVCDLHQQTQAR